MVNNRAQAEKKGGAQARSGAEENEDIAAGPRPIRSGGGGGFSSPSGRGRAKQSLALGSTQALRPPRGHRRGQPRSSAQRDPADPRGTGRAPCRPRPALPVGRD